MDKEKCANCTDSKACVPFFLHENAMMHYNRAAEAMKAKPADAAGGQAVM